MSESSIPDGEQRRLQELLVSGEQLAQIGTWEWVPPAQELYWSQNMYRIFGFEPGEVRPTLDLVMEMAHPDDREALERNVRDLAELDAPRSGLRPNDASIPGVSPITPIGGRGVVFAVRVYAAVTSGPTSPRSRPRQEGALQEA